MVSSQVKATGPKDTEHPEYSCGGSPMPAEPPSDSNIPNLPKPTQKASEASKAKNSCQTGSKKNKSPSENKYLGVRVKMPVRDMLKNIRIAKGIEPKDLQGNHSKASEGEKKRVNTGGNRRRFLKQQTKSLEELAIIVEVLEEDLKTCQSYRLPDYKSPSASCSSELRVEDASPQGFMNTNDQENEIPLSPSYPSETSPVHSVCSSYPSPTYSQGADVFLGNQEEYSVYESDCYRYDGQYRMSCSPANSCEYQVPSPQESFNASPNPEVWEVSSQKMNCPPWPHSQHKEWSCMTTFLTQLEREENLLRGISDQELLAVDGNGRILLHRAVEEGKRSLVYVMARRMAALNKLDIQDSEGKTPLHLAAQTNQHLMVVDLVSLGAEINVKDRNGKTCLHLSAENGYIRVLEVLKGLMRDGVYINLEERDANGLSALQCAAVALNHTVKELELCGAAGWVRLHTLHQEQMIETLECLLQMECYLHTPVQGPFNPMKGAVDPKLCEQATFFQSNEIKARNNMIWKRFGYMCGCF